MDGRVRIDKKVKEWKRTGMNEGMQEGCRAKNRLESFWNGKGRTGYGKVKLVSRLIVY